MIRRLLVGGAFAGLLTLGAGMALRTANAQDPADKQEQQATKTISGKVTTIGNGGHSFSLEVSGENKNKMDFVVDKNTQVNGQVREGTAVTVQYQAMASGQNLAVSITAQA
jgi:hypothetical protein